jgi:CRP/FNR family transcriptional regulator
MIQSLVAELKQTAIANTLRHCSLFADMPANGLNAVAGITVIKSLAKGEYLFMEGSPVRGFYVVKKGAIKLHRLNSQGHEQVVHVIRPIECLAEESILSGAGYPADASATEDSTVFLVQRNEFLALLKHQPGLAFRLLKSVSQQVRNLIGLVDDLTLKDANTRLANWLIHHCANPYSFQPQRVPLQMTKRLLASELGFTSETLSRTLAKFRKQKLVEVKGRIVILVSPMRMVELLHGNEDRTSVPASCSDIDYTWSRRAEECFA